jgi:hypothetical protein
MVHIHIGKDDCRWVEDISIAVGRKKEMCCCCLAEILCFPCRFLRCVVSSFCPSKQYSAVDYKTYSVFESDSGF